MDERKKGKKDNLQPTNYDAVKAVTDPDNIFSNLYEKTCRAAMGRE